MPVINQNTGAGTTWFDPRTGKRNNVGPDSKLRTGAAPVTPPASIHPPSAPPTGDGGQGGPGWLSGPGYNESWYLRNGAKFDQPTESSKYWQANQGKFSQPWQGATYWDQNKGQFDAPWTGESNLTNNLENLGQKGVGEQYYGQDMQNRVSQIGNTTMGAYNDMKSRLGGRQDAGQFYDKTQGEYLAPSYSERSTESLLPTMPNQSYSENLYEQGNTGLNQFYDREWDKTQSRLNNQLAARGGFNSGAGLRLLEEGATDISARQAKEMQSLADQADLARSRRYGDVMSVSAGGDTGKMNRLTAGQSAAGMAGNENRLAAQALLEGANTADKYGVDRENLLREGAMNSQQMELARQSELAKNAALLDKLKNDRLTTGGNLAFGAGREDLSRLVEGGNLAGGVDTADLNKLLGGSTVSKTAQNSYEGRIGGKFSNEMDLAKAMSDVFTGLSSAAATEQRQIVEDQIRAAMAQGQLSAQEGQQQLDALGKAFDIAIKGAELYGKYGQGGGTASIPGTTDVTNDGTT